MKLIKNYQSPNFNKRKKGKLSYIILHYTALKNYEEALIYLCDKRKKVSSHFLINQNGNIYNLVNLNKRAWHAGTSYWEGNRDINSMSIGIELDFSSNKDNNSFSKKMIKSLIFILKKLKKKYKIKNQNILAHSDVAPLRKKDPGLKFPWKKLNKNNLAYYPNEKIKINIKLIIQWFNKNKLITRKKMCLFMLGVIGYNTTDINSNYSFGKLIKAYQMHYLQSNMSGKIDEITLKFMIKHFLNILLTKN